MSKVYTREEFVKKYSGFIGQAVKGTGLLAGTVIAQAIIESQGNVNGSYMVGGSKLARNSNNYFGIKCYGGWKGKRYNINTGEESSDGNVYIDRNACFRAYKSVYDSILDYVDFMKDNPRYAKHGVFKAKTVREQAIALKNAGYATSSDYPNMISGVYNGVKQYVVEYKKSPISRVKGSVKYATKKPLRYAKNNPMSTILIIGTVVGVSLGLKYYIKHRR